MKTRIFLSFVIVLATTCVCLSQVGAKKAADNRVETLLDDTDLKYQVDSDGDFRLVNKLKNDRTQLVLILSRTSKFGTLEIRQIWSVGYRSKSPFSAELANRLLKENTQVKIGAWQVRKMDDDYVAVFCAQIAADTDKVSLMLALQAVSSTADELEEELTGKDDL